MLQFPILTVIIFWPILGSFVVLAVYRRPDLVRGISLLVTLVEMALVAALFFLHLQPHATSQGTWLLLEDYAWIPWLGRATAWAWTASAFCSWRWWPF